MVKMKDVAAHAGVSIATVSNVITGKRVVSPEVQKVVLDAIAELDYHVDTIARGLKTQRTYTIGVVLPDVTKLFFNDILKGIMNAAYDHGYSINILSSKYDFNHEKQMISSLRGQKVDAIILDSCVDYREVENWGREITSLCRSIPVVSLESTLGEAISSIGIDNHYWSSQITQHLIDQGRQRIFCLSGPTSLLHERDRLRGYREALKNNGRTVDESLIASLDYSADSAYRFVHKLFDAGLDCDAIQATSDQTAIGAIKVLNERGIAVPGQVAVAGFDGLFPGTLVQPSVSTVHVPRYTMGYEAVLECLRRIEDPESQPKNILLEGRLIPRNSTADLPAAAWDLDNW